MLIRGYLSCWREYFSVSKLPLSSYQTNESTLHGCGFQLKWKLVEVYPSFTPEQKESAQRAVLAPTHSERRRVEISLLAFLAACSHEARSFGFN